MHKRDKNVYYFCTLIMVCAEILIESKFTGSISECNLKRNIKKRGETPSSHLLVPSVSPIYHHFLRISGAVCAQ
jgi:hypothetical protein